MLQYLIILLDDTSVSFCHYDNGKKERRIIGLDDLKAGILFAMKENLNIQFVYPDYGLPQEYNDLIETIDHTKIMPAGNGTGADVVVVEGCHTLRDMDFVKDCVCVVRTDRTELFKEHEVISAALEKAARLNIVITDMERFTEDDFVAYSSVLASLSKELERLYADGKSPQLNILTDRMMLDKMNNCGAGDANITLAPDGKFYICPAFYLAGDDEDYGLGKAKFSIGDLQTGLDIKNPQLYKLDYAPLCRNCDACQCKRCVWLNRKTTYELNTPSHEQCVVAHLERNASRELLKNIRKHGAFMPQQEIKEIDYLDPFDKKDEL